MHTGQVIVVCIRHLRLYPILLSTLCYRQGLTKIRVIVKGLGAGFHQPVDGLHCLSEVSYTCEHCSVVSE